MISMFVKLIFRCRVWCIVYGFYLVLVSEYSIVMLVMFRRFSSKMRD